MAKSFAYMSATDSGVRLTCLDGSWEELGVASVEDAIDRLCGTDEGRQAGVPTISMVRILTPTGVVALDAAVAAPCAIAEAGGWRPSIGFCEPAVPTLALAIPIKPSRLEAEDCAFNALSDAIVAGAWDGLPGRGIFGRLRAIRALRRPQWFH